MADKVKGVARYGEPFWRTAGPGGATISYRDPFPEFQATSGPQGNPAAALAYAPARQACPIAREAALSAPAGAGYSAPRG